MDLDPLVSICCITFNHGSFIGKAIEGFLMQKTNFNYEIIIGEDCSTDNTALIVREYADKYPDMIRLITSEKNVGGEKNEFRVFMTARGKYIAICEGDDYWTDPDKLQKQVDFLEKNDNIAGCFHDVVNVDGDNRIINNNYYTPSKVLYDQREALIMRSCYASCSLVFRKDVLDENQKWYWEKPTDSALDLLITEKGLLAYLPGLNMAAYRIHKGGIWQGNNNNINLIELIKRDFLLLTNKRFNEKYSDIILVNIKEMISRIKPNNFYMFFQKLKLIYYYYENVTPKNFDLFKSIIKLLVPQLNSLKKKLFF